MPLTTILQWKRSDLLVAKQSKLTEPYVYRKANVYRKTNFYEKRRPDSNYHEDGGNIQEGPSQTLIRNIQGNHYKS